MLEIRLEKQVSVPCWAIGTEALIEIYPKLQRRRCLHRELGAEPLAPLENQWDGKGERGSETVHLHC